MAFFNKKKRTEEYEDDNLLFSDGFVIRAPEEGFMNGAHPAPHAITPEEVLGNEPTEPRIPSFNIPMDNNGQGECSSAAKALMAKMQRAKNIVEDIADDGEENNSVAIEKEPTEKKSATVSRSEEAENAINKTADEIFARAKAAAEKSVPKKEPSVPFASPEFMAKVQGFLKDEETVHAPQTYSHTEDDNYSLTSVEDILRSVERNVEKRTAEKRRESLANMDINYTDGTHDPEPKIEKTIPRAEKEITVTKYEENEAPVEIDIVHIDPTEAEVGETRPLPLSFQFSFADEDLPNSNLSTPETVKEEEDISGTRHFDLPESENTPQEDAASAVRDNLKSVFRLDPADEEDETDQEDFEEEYFKDYSCTDDAPEIRRDLKKRCSSLMLRIVPTIILTVLMLLFTLPIFTAAHNPNASVFRIASFVMLTVTVAINYNVILGITSLFSGQVDMDAPISIASIGTLIYSAFGIMSGESFFLGAPIGMLLLSANVARLLLEKRVSADFDVIANSNTKTAIKLVYETQGSEDIAKGSGLDDVLICGTQRTVNITGFLSKYYTEQPYERFIPGMLIAGGSVALLSGAISFALGSPVMSAIGILLLVFCLFCPAAYTLLSVLPMTLAATRVKSSGGLICGPKGAENIGDANAVVFNAEQLFPAGTVNLYQMKILSPNPIDQAIVEAAAVATAAKSPLADMFCRMAEGRMDTVSDPVDSVNLEGQMGISGWIKDRRILIGNRLLMETHGIAIPSVAVDKNILEKGFFPVYVACAGVPCALFVVGYNVDRRIKYELQRLCNTGVSILINSTDPNVSEEMVSDYFEIYRESVTLMSTASLNIYKNAVNYQESSSVNGIYDGSAEGLSCMVTTSVRLRSVISANIVGNIVLIILGALLGCYGIFAGLLSANIPLVLCIFNAVSLSLGCLIPLLYRP